jgi:hypothetical protein
MCAHGAGLTAKNPSELKVRIEQVVSGRRGFVSIAKEIKTCGMTRQEVKDLATSHGLVLHNHGKYGLCASLPW